MTLEGLMHTRCQILLVLLGLSFITRIARPRIWLLSIYEPTKDARISELMHGESQPSPRSDFVPIIIFMKPLENSSVTAPVKKLPLPEVDTLR